MVDTIWPVDAVAGAPSYSGRRLRQTQAPTLAMATTGRPLGARTGVRAGTPTNTVTVTSTTWTCKPVAGAADLESAAESGPYTFAFDANTSGSLTPAAASQDRIDIIYIQIDDPAEQDGSTAPTVTRKYLAGTPGSSTPPAPPVTRAFTIAQITVPRSGGGSPSVTWVAPYLGAPVIPFRDETELNAATPVPGHVAVLQDSGELVPVVGGAWRRQKTTSGSWTIDYLPSGKRIFRRRFEAWFGAAFGAAPASGWYQDRADGLTPPTGKAWSDFTIDVAVYPSGDGLGSNPAQIAIQGALTRSYGTGLASLRYYNPLAVTVGLDGISLIGVVTLTEL